MNRKGQVVRIGYLFLLVTSAILGLFLRGVDRSDDIHKGGTQRSSVATLKLIQARTTISPSTTPTPRSQQIIPTATAAPTSMLQPHAVVSSNQNINVRSRGTTDASIVGVAAPGSILTVLGENEDQTWLHVLAEDGKEGWVSASLVSIEPQSDVSPTLTNEPRTVASPTSTVVTVVECVPNMRRLSGQFRFIASDDGDEYSTYSYEVTTRTAYDDYEVLVYVGDEFIIPIFETDDGYQGEITIKGIPVVYLYEGEAGWFESLYFNFEFGGVKYSGDITTYDDSVSNRDRDTLHEDLEFFIARIQEC